MGSRPLSSLRARLLLLVLLTALPVTLLWGFSALQIRQRAILDAESFVLQVARGAVREYFGADLTLLEDRSTYSPFDHPFQFTPTP